MYAWLNVQIKYYIEYYICKSFGNHGYNFELGLQIVNLVIPSNYDIYRMKIELDEALQASEF
jgi:hypothetical protein